ncbi:hypothetical protein EDD66_101356 [Mobilisporobacter senegalensis]|uniref:Uncharacterized protein n=1 Tax=Mobilisporobacter senegalensis TaxID=1329262 RepID=A0A3N1XZN6_9FIRM|nr:hypothetical protein [Mobilisporobacter senegalensis]ROR31738.1 hypothetical protein EDD66_101356 [Mobilisporobacter senegalensis]
MDQRSPIEMIYLAIEYILIGAFLVMVTYALSIRNSYAETRNAQITSENNIRQYREFYAYNMGECSGSTCVNHIYGDEVIELIRKYYDDPDFEIYINKTDEHGSSLLVNITSVASNPDIYSLSNLQNLIDSKAEFHPYLVYNGISPSSITSFQNGSLGNVTGISLVWITDNKDVMSP